MADNQGCFVRIFALNEVPQKLVGQIKADLARSEVEFAGTSGDHNLLGEIYQEQLDYIRFQVKDGYFFAAFDEKGNYLGGTVLFLETDGIVDAPSPAFQGIAKSIFGRDRSSGIKLNSLLIPEIQKYLKIWGYDRMFVNPLSYQRKILMDHFGFTSIATESGHPEYEVYHNSPVLISKF